MKRLATICAVSAIALMATACNTTHDTHDADVKAIAATETQWNADFAAKDVDKLAGHYVDDAVLMGPGAPAASSKDAIRGTLKEMLSDPAFKLSFKADRTTVAKSGDVAYTEGTYTMTMTDPATKNSMTDHGGYVTGYRKQADGSWKAEADIVTSFVPPPSPTPAKH